MSEGRYCARLSIAFVGQVDTGVQTHKNSEMDGGSWVSVRTGPILSYCEHPGHVIARATAWNSAVLKAGRILPAVSDQPATERERVIAQITAQAHDSWDISGFANAAARDGAAVLFVRIGAVTFRCYDQAAVRSIQQVWRDAAMVARLLWRPTLAR